MSVRGQLKLAQRESGELSRKKDTPRIIQMSPFGYSDSASFGEAGYFPLRQLFPAYHHQDGDLKKALFNKN